ncbi:MAG: hypothetical protein ACKO9F_08195, partial [Caldilinea sp.]
HTDGNQHACTHRNKHLATERHDPNKHAHTDKHTDGNQHTHSNKHLATECHAPNEHAYTYEHADCNHNSHPYTWGNSNKHIASNPTYINTDISAAHTNARGPKRCGDSCTHCASDK